MKILYCDECNKPITEEDDGQKYNDRYFCSEECLHSYIDWDTCPITAEDFERDGEEEEDEDEIANDYDIQMGYAND